MFTMISRKTSVTRVRFIVAEQHLQSHYAFFLLTWSTVEVLALFNGVDSEKQAITQKLSRGIVLALVQIKRLCTIDK